MQGSFEHILSKLLRDNDTKEVIGQASFSAPADNHLLTELLTRFQKPTAPSSSARQDGLQGYQKYKSQAHRSNVPRTPNKQEPRTQRVARHFTSAQSAAAQFFTRLGFAIDEFSTLDEIKTSYRALAKRMHPDVHTHSTIEEARHWSERFQTLRESYVLLTK